MAQSHSLLIYNPRAGRIMRNPGLVSQLAESLKSLGGEVRAIPTTGPLTAGPLARQAVNDGASVVIVCGGDGTVNEAAQALAGTDIPLGALPGGTACVLSNELGLGNDPLRAARRLAHATPKRISLGQLEWPDGTSRRFLLMAGIGFDAHVVHTLDTGLKDRLGKLAYWAAAAKQLGRRLELFDVEAGGIARRASFALVSRVRNYGGDVSLARGASLFSDDFEVVLIGSRSVSVHVWHFAMILLHLERRLPGATIFKTRHLKARPDSGERVFVQVDGELAGEAPVDVRLVPDALTLLVPPEFEG